MINFWTMYQLVPPFGALTLLAQWGVVLNLASDII